MAWRFWLLVAGRWLLVHAVASIGNLQPATSLKGRRNGRNLSVYLILRQGEEGGACPNFVFP